MSQQQDSQQNKPEAIEETKELTPFQETGQLVAKYAAKLWDDERAHQFYAQLSLIAQQDDQIKMCTKDSLLTAMMACVHLDLMPNTPEQYAYIIPYKDKKAGVIEAQFQIGYKGMVELANRTGQVRSMHAELVFEGDDFDYSLGLERKLEHKPSMEVNRTDYSGVRAAYTTIKMVNGETIFDVMTRKELDKIKESAKAKSTDAPWNKWPEQMAKKTSVKRALKLVPASGSDKRLMHAVQFDSWAEAGKLGFDGGKVVEGEEKKKIGKDYEEIRAETQKALEAAENGQTEEGNDPYKSDKGEKEQSDDE